VNPVPGGRSVPVRQAFEMELLLAAQTGASVRALSRMFKVSRNTVRRILRAHEQRRGRAQEPPAGVTTPSAMTPRSSKLDAFLPHLRALLEKTPRLSAVRLHEEIQREGYLGGISILRERLRDGLRPLPRKEPVIRFETDPGEQGQMDWSPYTLRFEDGRRESVLCFSYILGYSRRQYIDFTLRRDFHTMIRRHRDAFEYFGGVPRQCLYDGEKTVLLRWEGGYPVYNPAFVAFSTHYACRPVGCKVRRPQTKGKVERPFQYVENNFLAGRTFKDLEDLKRMARWWMAEKSDTHVHDTTGRPPLELFLEAEAPALQALPQNPYDTCEVALRVATVDGFVEWETNRYSVPYDQVGTILTVKAAEKELYIYSGDLVALGTHERLPRGSCQTVTLPKHHAVKGDRYGLEPVRDAFLGLGPSASAFLEGLLLKNRHHGGYHARAILAMKESYHCDDIHKALAHASAYGAYESKAVERILIAKAKPRTLESLRDEAALRRLQESLPKIRQRPLAEYSLASLSKENGDEDENEDGRGRTRPEA
jgi:transposase